MKRLSNDEIFMAQAMISGAGSTCVRRMTGAVLTDCHNHIIGVGRNGVPSGMPHCTEVNCPGANLPSGTGLDECCAVHGEINSIIQCKDAMSIYTCYTTASPCISCLRALMNTSCTRIVFFEEYPHPLSKDTWLSNFHPIERKWLQLRTPFLGGLWEMIKQERVSG